MPPAVLSAVPAPSPPGPGMLKFESEMAVPGGAACKEAAVVAASEPSPGATGRSWNCPCNNMSWWQCGHEVMPKFCIAPKCCEQNETEKHVEETKAKWIQ